MNELISIILPCYNSEATIVRCIESVYNQTYTNFELIIVNDGSVDQTEKICCEWVERDSRIKYFYQKNAGVSEARNCGLKKIRGEYCAFIDADDWYESNFIMELYKTINKTNSDIACCAYKIEQKNHSHDVLGKTDGFYEGYEFLEKILLSKNIQGFVCNKLFRKQLFDKVRFNRELSMCEDLYLLCEMYSCSIKMSYVNKALYHYWVVGLGASQSEQLQVTEDGELQVVENILKMQNFFSAKREKMCLIQAAGENLISTLYDDKRFVKRRYNIKKQARRILIKYLLSESTLKNKVKFILITI